MENLSGLCISDVRNNFLLFVTFICYVHGNSECRRENGQLVNMKNCAQITSCLQYEDKVNISWNPPQDGGTIDFFIGLVNVSLNGSDFKTVLNTVTTYTVRASSTKPRIDISNHYTAIVKRRYSIEQLGNSYMTRKECTKVGSTTMVGGVTSDPEKVNNDPGKLGQNHQYVILIVLSVAVSVALLIVLLLACRYYKKRRIGNLLNKPTNDNRIGVNTTDQPCVEDTYNHVTLRYQEKKITQERISQDIYAHITEGEGETPDQLQVNSNNSQPQLSRRYNANYDDIPYEYDECNKTKQATVNIGTTISDNVNENGSTPDVLQGPITGDVYATVDKSDSKSNGDTLSRVEGPQGDLYTEVAIKR